MDDVLMEETPTVSETQERLREHSYAKYYDNTSEESTVATTPTSSVANADDIIVNVTQLDKDNDTFESLLLELLKSYSLEQKSDSNPSQQIIPEALDTLSNEQINSIVSSSVVNYQSIQHVLKLKKEGFLAQSPNHIDSIGIISEVSGHSPLSDFTPSLSTFFEQSSITNATNKSSINSSTNAPNGTVVMTSPGAKTPSISIKISPDQLKNLQSQITEMFKQQNLRLPEGLSSEQQQQVLNSLIATQLNASLQQLMPSGSVNNSSGCVSGTTPSLPTITTNSSNSNKAQTTLSTVSTGTAPSTGGPLNSIANLGISKTVSKSDESIRKKKDPDSKRPPTAFNLFFSEMYPAVQEQQTNISFSEASKMVSGLWSGLGQDGKKKYYDKCELIRNEFNTRIKETPPTEVSVGSSDQVNSTNKKHNKREEREKEEGMCLSSGCYNIAVKDKNRGTKFCSNECIVNHSKILFHGWITHRRLKT